MSLDQELSLFQLAIDSFYRAVAYDNNHEYFLAIQEYRNGLRLLREYIIGETNTENVVVAELKMEMYNARLTKLENFMNRVHPNVCLYDNRPKKNN